MRSVQVAILTGSVNKSRDDRVVCMWVQLKRGGVFVMLSAVLQLSFDGK